ncbi:hypothetical protein G3I44_18555 [Halogeometricum borinquense]|uniref:Uncharacterized protein n=1 Tax=Halogeometricum borinquense TaxID=60847 RepID=A0A6C0UKU2_9EURY|nr:hypothetical protein [Halogeometricum borinquense]QIB76095.1 hypothetical protein G3I44_18555 [Halogeometricum borinquense]
MAQIMKSARAFGIYLISLFTALLVSILVGTAIGGSIEPRTPSRAVVVVVFFTTLIGLMVSMKKFLM